MLLVLLGIDAFTAFLAVSLAGGFPDAENSLDGHLVLLALYAGGRGTLAVLQLPPQLKGADGYSIALMVPVLSTALGAVVADIVLEHRGEPSTQATAIIAAAWGLGVLRLLQITAEKALADHAVGIRDDRGTEKGQGGLS